MKARKPSNSTQAYSNQRTLNRKRLVNIPAINRSKLTVREGEAAIVSISPTTMGYLIDRLLENATNGAHSDQAHDGMQIFGLFTVDELVSLLDDHKLGASIASQDTADTLKITDVFPDKSEIFADMRLVTQDDSSNDIEISTEEITRDDAGEVFSVKRANYHLALKDNYAAVVKVGNTKEGDPLGGFVFIVNGDKNGNPP